MTTTIQETKPEVKPLDTMDFLRMALKSVKAGIETIHDKGTSIRFSADYCNSVVEALKLNGKFKDYSDTEVKLALKPLFEATILNVVAKELQVIKDK